MNGIHETTSSGEKSKPSCEQRDAIEKEGDGTTCPLKDKNENNGIPDAEDNQDSVLQEKTGKAFMSYTENV